MASRADWTAAHPAPPPRDGPASPTPPLVRPTDPPPGGDPGQQSCAERPPGARLFSAGSAAPPQAALVEMPGAGKTTPVRPEGREPPQYHVI